VPTFTPAYKFVTDYHIGPQNSPQVNQLSKSKGHRTTVRTALTEN